MQTEAIMMSRSWFTLTAAALFLGGCAVSGVNPGPVPVPEKAAPVKEMAQKTQTVQTKTEGLAQAKGVKELADQSDAVVAGKFKRLVKTMTEEGSTGSVEKRIYEFAVSDVLKGNLYGVIWVELYNGHEFHTMKTNGGSVPVAKWDDLPELGQNNILFLRYNPLKKVYEPSLNTYRIPLDKRNVAALPEPKAKPVTDKLTRVKPGLPVVHDVSGLPQGISGKTLNELKREIGTAVQRDHVPTTAPVDLE
jgi:hypothetical protein